MHRLGFRHDQEAPVICRWRVAGVAVKVMPIHQDNILGFSNPWYPKDFAQAIGYTLPDQTRILIMPAVYFVATKLAALRRRGMRDMQLSSDLEDILYLVDNRPELLTEIDVASRAVRACLGNQDLLPITPLGTTRGH